MRGVPLRPVPIHIVSGGAGSGKSGLIARLVRTDGHWLGLVNRPPEDADRNLKSLSPGCPCCIGRVVLQVTLARALRESRATRAFVELADAGHAVEFGRVLAERPFSLSVYPARGIELPRDRAIDASELGG